MRRPILVLAALFLLSTAPSSAQHRGDFFIGYGFAFPSGGYLSLRYYPAERIGVEIFTSAFWNIFNYGAKATIHAQNSVPNNFISIGYSHITAYQMGTVFDTSAARNLWLSRTMEGIDLGVGREVEYDYKHFSIQAGPTYVLHLRDEFVTERKTIETEEIPSMFAYYLVATQLNPLPEKNAKPIRITPH